MQLALRSRSADRRERSRVSATDTLARFFHGLSDPIRVRILEYLLDGPKTAGEIVRHIGRPQSSVAAHVTCLRFCGYVEALREGRHVRYELIDPHVRQILRLAEGYLVANSERIDACQVIGRVSQ